MKKHEKVWKSILIALICLLVFISGAIYYVHQLRSTLHEELRNTISQTAESTAMMIEESIQNEIHTIVALSAVLEHKTSDPALLVQEVAPALVGTNFLRLGIADLSGKCITTDGFSFNVREKAYFQSAIKGEAVFSNTFEDTVSHHNINVFAAPIYQKGEITNVLFAAIETNQLAEKLLIETYDEQGFSELADENGTIIIQSDSKSKVQQIASLSELNFTKGYDISDMKYQQNDVTEFITPDGELRYLAYYRLNINDWYVLSIVPSSVVSGQINHFIILASITWLILACIFAGILWYLYFVRTKADRKMEELIFYDSLTNHYNYNRFRVKVQSILDEHRGKDYALIELDVVDFKMFNEFYGYHGGDQLLKIVMDACVQHCTKEEACSRITADHFILLLHTQNKALILSRLKHMLQDVEEKSSATFSLFNLSYKIGIYLMDERDQEFSKCHDRCAYAKKQISNTSDIFSFFSQDMYDSQVNEKKLESLMEDALMREEFVVYLQPKITLRDHHIHGAEALIRWNSPAYGLIPPNRFIPLFERNGFLEQLDLYVIEHVCQMLEERDKQQLPPLKISANLSKVYLFKADFIDHLMEVVSKFSFERSNLEFEITESVIFDRSEELKSIIQSLKSYGFSVAMDDFGSGYSSLNMLKDIPIDVMKLDQEFFHYNTENVERSKKIIESVIMMAKGLHIHTVAEGVEEEIEVTFLQEVGCDEVQGYYYSKPLPYLEFIAFYDSFTKQSSK